MYKGYNLTISEDFFGRHFEEWFQAGKGSYHKVKSGIKANIDSYKIDDNKIDASKMQANWFPPVKANIFLSHSHKDVKLAIALSEWIRRCFGLDVFIDSCLWGNSSVLQRLLDDEYCQNENENTYNYKLRNLTTSHVHMMLQTALATMIDVTECVIFLNTPNSICPEDVVNKTLSPWIYSELTTTKYVRNKDKEEYRYKKSLNECQIFDSFERFPDFKYNAPTEHLIQINNKSLCNWYEAYLSYQKLNDTKHALDVLYDNEGCFSTGKIEY